jgi:hypothetical protein
LEKCRTKQGKGFFTTLAIVLCGMTIIVLLGALLFNILFNIGQYEFLGKEKAAKVFIGQIITSVLTGTDFYKTKTEGDIIAEVEASRDLISDSYTISTIDYSWDIYEGTIRFGNGMSVKIDVIFRDNKPYMLHSWRQIE